ncbi:MAG: hypothetical protein DHS20C14_14370 [Phycisphaeraceae bacterium]|nr:MAG: hypothetical protein DHS20C14_14370 [Phycisphaeraceae bacterium]
MLTELRRACLFGGALFAAGIAAHDAHAEGFAFTLTSGVISADRIAGNDPIFQPASSYIPGFGNAAYSAADFAGSVLATNTELSFTHDRASSATFTDSYAGVAAYAYVLTPTALSVEWDFGAWAETECFVLNATDNVTLFEAGNTAAGHTTVALEPGIKYLLLTKTEGESAGGESFARFTFPEPCAADIDGNGVLNVDDIEAFVAEFLGGCD